TLQQTRSPVVAPRLVPLSHTGDVRWQVGPHFRLPDPDVGDGPLFEHRGSSFGAPARQSAGGAGLLRERSAAKNASISRHTWLPPLRPRQCWRTTPTSAKHWS